MNQLAVLDQNQEANLESAVNQCHLAASMKNNTIKSLKLAYGQQQLNQVLNQPEVANVIMSLQNSAIGFLTDRKDHGYDQKIVIQAAQEALTAGAFIHGNEFNIIAGRCYFAQSFFIRMVREYCTKNLIKRHFEYSCKYIEMSGKQKKFKVTTKIFWCFPNKDRQEQTESYDLTGMSEDQVIGKAKKRAHQWLYNELTDNNYAAVPDEDETFDMPEQPKNEEKPAPPTRPTVKTISAAFQSSGSLEDLEAKYKKACDEYGYKGDNEVHAAYTEMKETLSK